ncbi:MAG: NifU family protein [Brevundimonas sp.]|uniref:NifU family protein n=1 Tax=Brevundimonas sp. TaxID=1871086 RepID=UPI0025BF269D|nr:NifU family protein [Brevundimonas sp.]MBX3478169.1 NifU family protein [Brevundimonas sp.]
MFIQTETTPNPNVLMFLPGRPVSPEGPLDFPTEEAAGGSPLARALFALDGVAGVFFGADAVSVTRLPEGPSWAEMKAGVLTTLMDHFVSGAPLIDASVPAEVEGEDSEIVSEIKGLLDSRIRPAVAQDGGDILFDRFDEAEGVLYLRMRGACSGCPSSSATLKAGVEQLMRHYVPEVNRVEQVI